MTSPLTGYELAALRINLVSYARRHGPSYDEAEDIAQAVLVDVWAARRRLGDHIRAFAYTVARHRVADAWRVIYRRPTVPLEQLADIGQLTADEAPGPEQRAEAAESGRELAAMLARLSERDRRIVVLRVGHGLSAEEVRREVGMRSASGVRVAQSRGVMQLRAAATRWAGRMMSA